MNSLAVAMPHPAASAALLRNVVVVLTALLTTVDLFAVQAILPALASTYRVSPAAMGTAVNASTFGMALGGLAVALMSSRIDRRWGVFASLGLLAIPTALLASAPDLAAFTALRVVQGVFMSAAFTLTLAYLGERCSAADAAGAFAAYITGNVASNLFGRLISASVADHLGLAPNFYVFAVLNLAGAALVFFTLKAAPKMAGEAAPAATMPARSAFAAWAAHFRNPALRIGFALGFCILFAFIGTYTYVNFLLVRPPFALGMMALGFVYFVFAPSIVTTPLAGRAVARFGTRPTLWASLGIAAVGLPLTLLPNLPAVLTGLVLIAVGTFLAQATATGFVSRAATADRGAASGLYLASYFLGGLAGAFLCGQAFMYGGWPGCAAAIGVSLAAAVGLAGRVTPLASPAG
ncbi:MAG: MFS transporter [Rhodospirillaceae bacterium]|nr:MFS transporter [Rhodospirillaceae bacterium]